MFRNQNGVTATVQMPVNTLFPIFLVANNCPILTTNCYKFFSLVSNQLHIPIALQAASRK